MYTLSAFIQRSQVAPLIIITQFINPNQSTKLSPNNQFQVNFVLLIKEQSSLSCNTYNIHIMQDALADFKIWYFSKPLFTRTYLAICTTMSLFITLRLIAPLYLFYTFEMGIMHLQLWRPLTAIFYMGKFDFSFIFSIYFAYIALNKVQTQVFSRQKYHDFLWLLVLLFTGCVIIGSIFQVYFFTEIFLMSLVYIWCKRLPHEEIRIMFGLVVKTGYFPFVYAIMMSLFGGSLINYIIGIILGHIYIFVKDIAVLRYHRDYLATPRWFSDWWFGRQGQAAGGAPRNNGGGFFQGQGVRLQ